MKYTTLLIAMLFTLSASSVLALENITGLQGTVFDTKFDKNKIIQNAKISFINELGNISKTTYSNKYGEYRVMLEPGRYKSTVSHKGFNVKEAEKGFSIVTENKMHISNFFLTPKGDKDSASCGNGEMLKENMRYGSYVIDKLEILENVQPGTYFLTTPESKPGNVGVFKGSTESATLIKVLQYDWKTKINNNSKFYTFYFDGLFNITIKNSGEGSLNLYNLYKTIFNKCGIKIS